MPYTVILQKSNTEVLSNSNTNLKKIKDSVKLILSCATWESYSMLHRTTLSNISFLKFFPVLGLDLQCGQHKAYK